MPYVLRPYQLDAVDRIRTHIRAGRKRVLCVAPTGAGKCLGLGTPVLTYGGHVVAVEDVKVGDRLLGPDGRPRYVLSTARGQGQLYRIVPVKGSPWVCNDVHVLTLVHTETNAIVDIDLQSYLAKSKSWRHCHKLFMPESGVEFGVHTKLAVDPYFMGLWFGDGHKRPHVVGITTKDPEIEAFVREMAASWGLRVRVENNPSCPTYFIVGVRGAGNPLLKALKAAAPSPREIPGPYRRATRRAREAFLAGILDADGCVSHGGIEIAQLHKGIADGVAFIARSLGLRVTTSTKKVGKGTYHRLFLSGDFRQIPMRLERRRPEPRRQKKIATRTGFTVEPIGLGLYAGFELAGDGRFLLGDFTVTHNTVIASHIIECSVGLGNRILFLAHRRELITQAFKKVIGCTCRPGYEHDSLLPNPDCRGDGMDRRSVGVVMAHDRRRNPGAVVQVASIDTLRNRARPPADLIIVDEAHRSLAATYRIILEAYPEAAIIGLTATPYRADRRGLGEEYDELVVVSSVRELIAQGALVQPRVFTVPAKDLPDLSRVRIKGNDYDPTQLSAAVDRKELVGNIVEHWQRLASDRLTVVFAASVEHSKHIAAQFKAAGVAAEHLDGMTPTEERDAILARLECGETRVVVNYGVLVEGWDQPSVKCAILARPTKSKGAYLQMAGRILRPYMGLDALILDHAGCTLEHGFVEDDREFTLEAAPKKPKTAATGKTCPECFAIVPIAARICEACEHVFEAQERSSPVSKEGTLVEVRPATQDEKRVWWNAICVEAVGKGYKKGWAAHRFKDEYGTWPPNSFAFPERPRPFFSDGVKRDHLAELRDECAARGYHAGWVEQRYRAKFGEDVPAAWLMPRVVPVAKAVGDTVASSALEDWGI